MAERDIIARIVVEGGQQAATQLDNVAKSEREIVAATKEANTALNTQNQQLSENTAATKGAASAQESLRTRLKELKAQMALLAVESKKNTEEYRRLRKEAGQLDDAIKDVNAEIAQAGSDTRGLDKVIRIATTATAGFGLLEGATALFGSENEELQKSLLKVNAAMTILTSLQQIQNEYTKGDTLFTSLAAKAKDLYARATQGATGATNGFRAALVATGIGVAIAGLGLLVANWDRLKIAIFGASNALDDYNKKREKDKELVKQQSEINNAEISALEAKAKLLRSEGKIAEATAADRAAANARITEAERLLNVEKSNAINLEKQISNAIVQRRKQLKEQIETQTELTLATGRGGEQIIKLQNQLKNVGQIVRKEWTPAINEQNIALDNAQAAYDNAKAELNDYNKELSEDALKKRTKQEEDAAKAAEKAAAARQKQSEEFRQWEASYENFIKKEREALALFNSGGIAFTNSLSEQQKFIQSLTEDINNLAPDDPKRTNLIKLLIESEFQLKKLQDETEQTAAFIKATLFGGEFVGPVIPDFVTEYEKQQEIIRQKRIQEREQRIGDAQKIAAATFAVFTQLQAAQQQVLDNRLKQGLISEEEYQREVAKLRTKQAVQDKLQAIFNATINLAQAISTALAKTGNPIVAGIVAGLAAAQLAAIIATPIPKFRYGGQVLGGGSISPEGMLSGRSHAGGGMLIEAEGGEFITRKEMTKKYLPILKAINQDKLGDVLYPKIPIMRTFGSVASQSQRKADKRMEMLIEEVQFMSQYIRQGNKYARVTADNTSNLKTSKKHHRV